MSVEGDNTSIDLGVLDLLEAILFELKRLNIMISEMSEQRVIDEDVM